MKGHLFYKCVSIKYLWEQLIRHFHVEPSLPVLTPPTALFGLLDDPVNNKRITDHILLLLKLYINKLKLWLFGDDNIATATDII